jgi:hypothetical protein
MEVIYSIMLLFLMLSSALTTAFIAKRLGRNFWFWLVVSFPLSVVALCILLCLPAKQEKPAIITDKRLFDEMPENENMNEA